MARTQDWTSLTTRRPATGPVGASSPGVSKPGPSQNMPAHAQPVPLGENVPSWWPEALRLKDRMPLRDLADHLGVRVGLLTAELRRAGIARAPVPTTQLPDLRHGSKDGRISSYFHLLGQMPDADVARLSDVSVRTIASYRARHGIPGYEGPRRRPEPRGSRQSRLEDFRHLLGRLPDRVVADEAGMSLGAVRNFRIKHDIEAAGRLPKREIDRLLAELRGILEGASEAPAPAPAAQVPTAGVAWRVVVEGGNAMVVVAESLRGVIDRVVSGLGITEGQIRQIEAVGPVMQMG